jgi:hypothetical protein
MIDHFIAFKAELTPEGEQELFGEWNRLREIPGIVQIAIGRNFGDRSRGFDYCLRVTFETEDALESYEAHPIHVDIRTYNRAHSIEHICMDFGWVR